MKCEYDDAKLLCGEHCYIKRTIWDDGGILTTTVHGEDCHRRKPPE